jgi:type I restriction enzyme S subunit
MSAALLENFDLFATSVGGVARLRELILSLAVRGSLMPQDPNDEPAGELLKRIRAEKDRLIKEGRIKRNKPLPDIFEDEKPYQLPVGWEWVRLADLVTVLNGRAYKQHELLEAGTPVLRVGNLFTSSHWYYSDLTLEDDKYCEEGDLLFAWSASFGPFIWSGPKAIYHYHIWKLNLHSPADLNKQYLYTFLHERTQELKAGGHGVSMLHMTKDSMEKTLAPLPPLAEQSRIVAKVEELMALCDRFEAEQGHAARVQGHWVEAALDQLAESADADEFRRHWQHLAAHFDTLFTTAESIDHLDATLLQLAVRGKLVPQDPSDEPASELLKQIRAEKDRLIKEGRIKRDKQLLPVSDDEKPYELPEGWEWARFSDVILASDAGWSPSCESVPRAGNQWGVLKVSAVTWGEFRPNENKALPDHLDPRPECEVKAGDFLLSRANTEDLVARSVVAWKPPGRLMLSDKLIRLRLSSLVDKALFCFINNATDSRAHYIANASGTSSSMKNVSREVILSLPVPIPPVQEQSRIVAELEKLQSLTASLKARLTAAQTKQAHLAEALIAEVA